MRLYKVSCWFVSLALLLALGCATRLSRPSASDDALEMERREQMKLALSVLIERQTHTWRVGNKLRRAGADLCGEDVRYTFGFFAIDRENFSKDYREIAAEIGLDSGVRIWEVLPEFQASENKLKKGDKIVQINGKNVSDFKSFEKAMQEPFDTGELSMNLIRSSGEEVSVSLHGASACDYRAAVLEDDSVNAFADGKNVFLTTGMIRFTESDDEIALVLGHEFAHNALEHLRQMRVQAFFGYLVDLAVAVFADVDTQGLFSQLGRRIFSEEFEADADYMGLYLAARAGYNIQIAPSFWRRMAVEHPGNIQDNILATHPSTPERAVTLKQTIAEIEAKKKDGKPLMPEFK